MRIAAPGRVDKAARGFDPNDDPGGTDRAELAIAWLNEKWGDEKGCAYCGGTAWG